MCDLKSMCGSCTSKNSIEIYPVFKPWEPTKLALDKYQGVRIARDESIISFGAEGDVLFARTGEGKLVVQAKHIDFESAVTVKGSPIAQGVQGGRCAGGVCVQGGGAGQGEDSVLIVLLCKARVVARALLVHPTILLRCCMLLCPFLCRVGSFHCIHDLYGRI